MAKPKISMKGGRVFAMHICHKDVEIKSKVSPRKAAKERRAAKETSTVTASRGGLVVVQGGSVGRRTHRAEALIKAEQTASERSPIKITTKAEKSLRRFAVGVTKGTQKNKGKTKPPRAFAPTSQCHTDVFYADSSKKWGVAPPPIDPLKTCRVK